MNYSAYYADIVSRLYVTGEAAGCMALVNFAATLPGVPRSVIAGKDDLPQEHRERGTILLTYPKGRTVGRCPGTHGHLCCNYVTIDLYMGCTLGCTYCIMKYYLNFSPVTVYADTRPGIDAVREIARENPGRAVRVGTGEVGDSLLFDPLFRLSAEYIDAFSDLPNVQLELKTKTDFIDHLLDLPRKGNAVIGFSVNADSIVASEDGTSVSLERRIAAARRAVEAGYRVAFHFDPIFNFPGWQDAYGSVVDRISVIPGDRIAWISMGTFRYPPMLKERIDDRPYLYAEFVPCRDGKFRYLQKIRIGMYRFLAGELAARSGAPLYLCMESADVWRSVFDGTPRKIGSLRDIFSPVRSVRRHGTKN